jgi:hypothetical protein
MKKITFILGLFLLASTLNAQILFQSDFETWNAGVPDGWNGAQTNIGATNFLEYTTSAQSGSSACQLINSTSTHKRFTTTGLSITSAESYDVIFWVRGQGEIRTGLYNGVDPGQNAYASYIVVNSPTWTMYTQTLTSNATSAAGEFIFSLRNTNVAGEHLQIDNITIQVSTASFDTLSIYDIQYTTDPSGDSPVKDQTVYTYGVVTAFKTGGFFIQDGEGPWNGLYIYNNTYTVDPGDSILIKGNITEYFNMTEMTQVSSLEILGQSTIPAPSVITTAQVNTEAYESVLVKVMNAECTNPAAGYGMWAINDGSGVAKVDTFYYTYTPTLGVHYNVTGPVMYGFSEFRIEPRNAADVEIYTSIGAPQASFIEVFPNPASDIVSVVLNSESNISISNILGQTVYSSTVPSSMYRIDVSTWQKGLYLLSIITENGDNSVYKLIIQ